MKKAQEKTDNKKLSTYFGTFAYYCSFSLQSAKNKIEAELDRERGYMYWEVDFNYQNQEYSYDVNAETGDITKVECEIND